jgi:hypothetical protein
LGLAIQGAATLSGQYSHFNLSTGVATAVTSQSGTVVSASMTPFPNGWYRCVLVYTTASNQPATSLIDISITNSDGQHNYSGTGNLFIWGAQLEVGSFPTSYIPTTTAPLARGADVCNITGGDFNNFYNQSEGTLLLSADEFKRGVSYPALLQISNSADINNNRVSIVSYPKTGDAVPLEFAVGSGGTFQYAAIQTSTTSNFKAALAYKLDDARAALNGALAAADAPPSVLPIGADNLRIGGVGIYISSVRYYRKRLPDAKLQALTV